MATQNPQIPQGTLNRLRASVVFNAFPQLNVTAPFLGKEGISMSFEGDGAMLIPTLTGAAQSPEPFVMARVNIHLLKTQNLAAIFKAQFETNTNIGALSVFPDVSTGLPEYDFVNCVLQTPTDISLNGESVDYVIRIHGIYQINSALWGS